MPIVAFVASKGGAGKSTAASNLACALESQGESVAVVDCDAQRTLVTWAGVGAEAGHELPMVVGAGDDVRRVATELAKSYRWVLVDTPGRDGGRLRGALAAASLVVIPVRPSGSDAWALTPVLEALAEVRAVREGFDGGPAAVFLRSAWQGRTRMATSAEEALTGVDGIPLLRSALAQRTAFAEALSAGAGVVRYAGSDLAALEVQRLTEEVRELTEGASA